jgi:hypothetical protein
MIPNWKGHADAEMAVAHYVFPQLEPSVNDLPKETLFDAILEERIVIDQDRRALTFGQIRSQVRTQVFQHYLWGSPYDGLRLGRRKYLDDLQPDERVDDCPCPLGYSGERQAQSIPPERANERQIAQDDDQCRQQLRIGPARHYVGAIMTME